MADEDIWAKLFLGCTGWEHGDGSFDTGVKALYFTTAGSGFSVQNAVVKDGDYALELDRSAGVACGLYYGIFASGSTPSGVQMFHLRYETKPSGTEDIWVGAFRFGPTLTLRYNGGSDALELHSSLGNVTVTGPPLPVDRWVRIHIRWDAVDFTSLDADWIVDGALQSHLSDPAGGFISGMETAGFGTASTSGGAFRAYVDNHMIFAGSPSDVASVWPPPERLSNFVVRRLLPDGIGTHSNPGDFSMDTGALDGTEWTHIDEVPAGGASDYVQQDVVGLGSYLEFAFEDWTEPNSTQPVGAVGTIWQAASAAGDAQGTIQFRDVAGSNVDAYNLDVSGTAVDTISDRSVTGAPFHDRASRWTAAAINALTMRWGFASDVSPKPRLLTAMWEVAAVYPAHLFGYWDG